MMARFLSSIDCTERSKNMTGTDTISVFTIDGKQLKPANPNYTAVP